MQAANQCTAIIPVGARQVRVEATFKRSSLQPLFDKVFGKGLNNTFTRLFNAMDIAEQEIARAIRNKRDDAPVIWDTFKVLVPRMFLMEYAANKPELYRDHCQQLIERAVNGRDLAPATDAEVLVMLSKGSGYVPLHNTPAYVMANLFAKVLPNDYARMADEFDKVQMAEPYAGAGAELLRELRSEFADKDNRANVKFDLTRWGNVYPDVKRSVLQGRL